MTSIETAQLTMHNSFEKFLDAHIAIYQNDKGVNDCVNEFKALLTKENAFGPLLAADRTVFSDEKSNLKGQMSVQMSSASGYAYVALVKAGKNTEANQLDLSVSDFLLISDTEASHLAKSTLSLLQAQKAIITPDYVSKDELDELAATIEEFDNAQEITQNVNKTTPAQRVAFKTALSQTNDAIDNIRRMSRKYLISNKQFHDELNNASIVYNNNRHHTNFSATITQPGGAGIANVTAMLSLSKKTGISNASGNLTIYEVRNGNTTLTLKAEGYKDQVQNLNLARGKDNHVNVVMEKV